MTKKNSSPNSSPKQIAKSAGGAALFIALSIVGTIIFYTLLTLGVLLTISGFFGSESAGVLIGTGVALLLVAFLGNLFSQRIFYGTWKISWPSFPGM